jgi:hypothetical protein
MLHLVVLVGFAAGITMAFSGYIFFGVIVTVISLGLVDVASQMGGR